MRAAPYRVLAFVLCAFASTHVLAASARAQPVLAVMKFQDETGVMPLPPAKATIGAVDGRSTKRPDGGMTSIRSPAFRWSFIQLDMRPSTTRFTVVLKRSPASGELDIE